MSPVRTSFESPWQNGVAERWAGNCRRDLLDHIIAVDERHTSGKEAVEKTLQWEPDLVLLDIRLPLLFGFDAARIIKQHQPETPVLFFSIYDTEEILEEARLAGDGFILKETIVEILPNAIDALLHKQPFFPSDDRSDRQN